MLETFEIPAQEAQRGCVFWMHGLGASNHDFDDVIPLLKTPFLKFIFPAAPVRAVTVNGGMPMPAWYDILSFDQPSLRENVNHVRDAAKALRLLIQAEVAGGTQPERIVLLGFSQGGAMALYQGLRNPEKLAGIGVLSAYMLDAAHFEAERSAGNQHTPVLCCHGSEDAVVRLPMGLEAVNTLKASGYEVSYHEFPMGHSMCMEEIVVLRDWLHSLFAGPS